MEDLQGLRLAIRRGCEQRRPIEHAVLVAGKAQRDEDHQKAVEDNAKVALRECVDALLTLQEVDAKTALEDHATIVLHGV